MLGFNTHLVLFGTQVLDLVPKYSVFISKNYVGQTIHASPIDWKSAKKNKHVKISSALFGSAVSAAQLSVGLVACSQSFNQNPQMVGRAFST